MRLLNGIRASQTPADGWVSMDTSGPRARSNAFLRHPFTAASSRLLRKRGLSRFSKEPSSADDILQKTADLPISVWTYGFDHPSVRHLGPMAQDFARAFGLGSSDRRIDMVDANGVALACIQALYRRVVALEQEVAELRRANSAATPNAGGFGAGAADESDTR